MAVTRVNSVFTILPGPVDDVSLHYPEHGAMVYDTNFKRIYYADANGWVPLRGEPIATRAPGVTPQASAPRAVTVHKNAVFKSQVGRCPDVTRMPITEGGILLNEADGFIYFCDGEGWTKLDGPPPEP